jgi:hypothetical protein
VIAVSTMTMDAEAELPNRLSRLPWYAPAGFGAAQPASWPRILSVENEADALRRVTSIPSYLPAPHGLSAVPPQPSGWPQVWSTEAELDLQSRLSRLPFYTSPIQAMRMAPAMGLGDITSDIQTILTKAPELLQKAVQILNNAGPHLDTIIQITQDPALAQIIARIKTLQASAAAKPSAPATPAAPGAAPTTDTGISKLIPALDAAIFLDKHPAAQFAADHPVLVGVGAAVAILGIGFGVGIGIGRWTKKCRTAAAVGSPKRYRRRR